MNLKTAKSIFGPNRPLVLFAVFFAFSAFFIMRGFAFVSFLMAVVSVGAAIIFAFTKAKRLSVLMLTLFFAAIYPAVFVFFAEFRASATIFDNKDTVCSQAVVYEKIEYPDKTVIFANLEKNDGGAYPISIVTDQKVLCERFDLLTFEGIFFKSSDDEAFRLYYEQNVEKSRILSENRSVSVYASEIQNLGRLSPERRNFMQTFYFYIIDNFSECMDYTFGCDTFSFAKALLTGDRASLPDAVTKSFSLSGILHLLCISGLHVVIISSLFDKFLLLLKIRRRPRVILTSALLLFFVAATGGTGPVMRAAAMSLFFKLFLFFNRKSDSFCSYAFSYCAVALFKPFCLFDVGTLLSFLSMAGLVASEKTRPHDLVESDKLVENTKNVISSCFFAQGFVVVPCLFFFGRVNILSVFANYFSAFIFTPLMFFLVILALFGFLPTGTREILALPAEFLCTALAFFTESFSGSQLAVTHFSLPRFGCLFFALLFSAFIGMGIFSNRKKIGLCGFFIALFSNLFVPILHLLSVICD